MRLLLFLLVLAAPLAADPRGTCFQAQKGIEKLEALLTKRYYEGHETETYKPYAECSEAVKKGIKEQEKDARKAETSFARIRSQLQGLPASEMVKAELAWGEAVLWLLQMNLQGVYYFHGMPSTFDQDRSPGLMDAKGKELTALKARYLQTRR